MFTRKVGESAPCKHPLADGIQTEVTGQRKHLTRLIRHIHNSPKA